MGFGFGGEFSFGSGGSFGSGPLGTSGGLGIPGGVDLGGGSSFDPGLVGGNLGGVFGSTGPGAFSLGGLAPNPAADSLLRLLLGDIGAREGTGLTGSNGFLGIPGTGGIDSILETILGGASKAGGTIIDALGGIFGGGGIGGILESILGGGRGGQQAPGGVGAIPGIGELLGLLGGGQQQGAGGINPLLLLALAGAGFANGDQTSKQRVPPLSLDELQLLGINKELALRQLQAFQQQQELQGSGNSFLSELYQQMIGSQQGASVVNNPLVQGLIEQGRRGAINDLGFQDAAFNQGLLQDFRSGGRATPDQLANIQGAADSAISAGLSDIGRFRDEGLNRARLNSATRGLRPTDTPIQNDFANVQQEANRQASDFITNIRGQQFAQNLQFPLEANQQRLGQFSAGLDQSFRRRALEEELARLAQQQRLQLGGQISQVGLGLTPSQSPAQVANQLGGRISGNVTTTDSQSQLNKLLGIFGAAGNLGLGR